MSVVRARRLSVPVPPESLAPHGGYDRPRLEPGIRCTCTARPKCHRVPRANFKPNPPSARMPHPSCGVPFFADQTICSTARVEQKSSQALHRRRISATPAGGIDGISGNAMDGCAMAGCRRSSYAPSSDPAPGPASCTATAAIPGRSEAMSRLRAPRGLPASAITLGQSRCAMRLVSRQERTGQHSRLVGEEALSFGELRTLELATRRSVKARR